MVFFLFFFYTFYCCCFFLFFFTTSLSSTMGLQNVIVSLLPCCYNTVQNFCTEMYYGCQCHTYREGLINRHPWQTWGPLLIIKSNRLFVNQPSNIDLVAIDWCQSQHQMGFSSAGDLGPCFIENQLFCQSGVLLILFGVKGKTMSILVDCAVAEKNGEYYEC